MSDRPQGARSAIVFLYYKNLASAVDFYERILGLEPVVDQGFAKIYRLNGSAFLGIVDGAKGHFRPQAQNAMLVTLVVDEVGAWHRYLEDQGVGSLTPVEEDPKYTHFYFEDPGGYTLEVQSFAAAREQALFRGATAGTPVPLQP